MAAPLRARNVGTATFTDAYDGEVFVIEPGEEVLIPPEAAALWFGDPHSVNEELNRARDAELERLKVRYGQHVAELEGDTEGWENRHPKVEVLTMADEAVATVLSDPSGKSIHAASQSVSEQEQLMDLIRAQGEELAKLKAQYVARQRETEALSEGSAEADTPKQVASKRARTREMRVEVPGDLPEDVPAGR